MARSYPIEFRLLPDTYILCALALLILPLRWILSAVIAAGFHEMCHFLALKFCRVRIYSFCIGTGGAQIVTEPMGAGKELLCALAGPAGSLALLCLIRWLPCIAVCAGIQGIYNLLPIYPLDGGRVLNGLLGLLCPNQAEIIMKWIQRSTAGLILAAGVYGFFILKLGSVALIGAFLLLQKAVLRKRP